MGTKQMNAAAEKAVALRRNVQIELQVNGEPTEVSFAPYKTLLEVLREDLNLPGTKHGCELGECGACAVLLDGEPVLSCLALAVECAG
ncbi:MAG: 2Fe-2S iron-sulfur cluster-binding protein, partial [Burkholderiales bacterium]|nr:2Fe-2S iron-sulfur cluster-binding protein [Burkholderiales bacterium]